MENRAPQASNRISAKKPTLQLFLPAATRRPIVLQAAETGETVRVIVLRALSAYGFHVPEDALVNRRKPR